MLRLSALLLLSMFGTASAQQVQPSNTRDIGKDITVAVVAAMQQSVADKGIQKALAEIHKQGTIAALADEGVKKDLAKIVQESVSSATKAMSDKLQAIIEQGRNVQFVLEKASLDARKLGVSRCENIGLGQLKSEEIADRAFQACMQVRYRAFQAACTYGTFAVSKDGVPADPSQPADAKKQIRFVVGAIVGFAEKIATQTTAAGIHLDSAEMNIQSVTCRVAD